MIWNIINLGQTDREINSYSSELIIAKMTFQLRRFDSYKKTMEIKTLKRHVFLEKKYKNKNDFDLIKVLFDSRSNHAWEINYHMS